jgi:hypothetical protein
MTRVRGLNPNYEAFCIALLRFTPHIQYLQNCDSCRYGKDKAFPHGAPQAQITISTGPSNIISSVPRSSSPLQNSPSSSPSVQPIHLANSPNAQLAPPSPSSTRSPRPLSQTFGKDPLSLAYRLSSTPPTDKAEKNSLYNSLLKSSVAIFQGSPNSTTQPAESPLNARFAQRSYSFNGLFNHLTATLPTTGNSIIAQSLLDEQKQQFEDLVSPMILCPHTHLFFDATRYEKFLRM